MKKNYCQGKPAQLPRRSENHVVWHHSNIQRLDRQLLNNHQSGVLWFTGLPGAGKSSIAHGVENELHKQGIRVYVLDGDNIRHGLNADLGFGREDRRENLRRIVEVAGLMADAGILVLTAFVSPYAVDRDYARRRLEDAGFWEIYVKCRVEECARRDIKGHYQKARQGLIRNFTGVSSPYEAPENPQLVIDTESLTLNGSVQTVIDFIMHKGILCFPETDSGWGRTPKKRQRF